MLKRRKCCLCSNLTPLLTRRPSLLLFSHPAAYIVLFDEKGKRRWWHFTCCSQHYTIQHDILSLLSDSYVSLNFFNEDALEGIYTHIYIMKRTWGERKHDHGMRHIIQKWWCCLVIILSWISAPIFPQSKRTHSLFVFVREKSQGF